TLAASLEKEYPDANKGRSIALQTLAEARANPLGAVQNPLPRIAALLLLAVGLILLIACANVANLLLARASTRQKEIAIPVALRRASTRKKEIAIRVAMGATRRRLLRQLLTESLVLALAGAAGGLVIASWFTKLLMSLQPPGPFPLLIGARIDPRVLAFTLVV